MSKFKRICLVFVSVVMFAMCGLLTGCGDKYKKLSWEIFYSFTEGENWQKVEGNNLELFFGKDLNLKPDDKGDLNTTMYLQVKVNGVKAKDLGQIVLTNLSNGRYSGSDTIQSGTILNSGSYISIPLKISKNERIDTKLSFRELNSGKSTNINYVISPVLTSMEMNTGILTPVVKGSSAKLDALNTIKYNPEGSTMRGAKFSFDNQIGYYILNADGTTTFKADDLADYSAIKVSEDGTISVAENYKLTSTNYAIRVKATSIFNPEIFCYVDAYVVEEQNYVPRLDFKDGGSVGESFTLYPTSKFNAVDLVLSQAQNDNIYYSGVQTINPNVKAKYNLNVYLSSMGGASYNTTQADLEDGIKITIKDGAYHVEASSKARANKITFKYEIGGLTNAGNLYVPSVSSNIDINYLPTKIKTDLEDENPSTPEIDTTIYNTQNQIYAYFQFLEQNTIVNELQLEDDMLAFNFNGQASTQNTKISINQRVDIKFNDKVNEGSFVVKALCVPEFFAGKKVPEEFITLNIKVKKVVTASQVYAFAGDKTTGWSDATLDGAINLNNDINSAYIKVFYDGNAQQQFDNSSVQLTSSNQDINFIDGANSVLTINLSKLTEDSRGQENGLNFILYKIDFDMRAANNLSTSTISVVVGNGNAGVNSDANFVVRKVLPTTGELNIATQRVNDFNNLRLSDANFDSTLPQVDGKQTINYAVAITNNIAEFEVLDSNGQTSGIQQIKVVPNLVAGDEHFSNNALQEIAPANYRHGTNFSFRAAGEYTQLLDIYTKHYVVENGIIILKEDILTGQFAGFNPIKNITISPSIDINNLRIAFVENFASAGKVDINFYPTEANVTKQIHFITQDGYVSIDNVNDLGVYYADGNKLISSQADLIDDVLSLNVTSSQTNLFNKTATLMLKKEIAAELINLTLVPVRLGNYNISAGKNVGVKIVGFENSSNVTISANGLENDNLYKSFIDATDISFDVNAVVSWNNYNSNNFTKGDLGYELLKYKQNPNGDIQLDDDGNPIFEQVDSDLINLSNFVFEKQTSNSVLVGKATFTARYRAAKQGGGIFKLKVYTQDSFDSETQQYSVYDEFVIAIGDGSLQNKFTINSKEDFAKINNALDAHYSLTKDIELDSNFVPIGITGNQVNMFTGSFDGTNKITLPNGEVITEQHSLTYTLNLSKANNFVYNFGVQDLTKNVAGLFAAIGANDSNLPNVSNLDVNVQLSNELTTSENDVAVGLLAGVNFGKIKQVNVNILGDVELTNSVEINSRSISFGGYAGINYGSIDMRNAIVKTNREITISSNFAMNNIGFIAGENSNGDSSILGRFSPENLNDIQYNVNVIANLQKTGSSQSAFNVGAVVGKAQAGSLTNLLIGGKITIGQTSANAYLGGIIGASTNTQISDCATLGLSLVNKSTGECAVAGIIAASTGGNRIVHTKVISSVEQNQLSVLSASEQNVKLAGILVQNDASSIDTISYSSVETISNVEGYHLQGKNVAGLAFGQNVNISSCFANINIKADSIYLITDGTTANNEQHCYFLGKAEGTISKSYKDNSQAIDNKLNYALVIKENSILYSAYTDTEYNFAVANEQDSFYQEVAKDEVQSGNGKSYFYKDEAGKYVVLTQSDEGLSDDETYYTLSEDFGNKIKSYVDETGTVQTGNFGRFNANYKYYYVNPLTLASEILSGVIQNSNVSQDYQNIWGLGKTNQIEINNITVDLPYLLYTTGTPLAIERLQSMSIQSINGQEHVEKIYTNKINNIHTTIINYHTTGNASLDSQLSVVNSNTYNILKSDDQSGLITLTRVPTSTPISFKIIEGGQFAQIVDNTKIRFTGVSGNLPIRLHIYSQFDETKWEDAIFFTQYGVTDMILSSVNNSVYSVNGLDGKEFVANLYFSNENKNSTGLDISVDTINTKTIHNFLSIYSDAENLRQIANYLQFEFVTQQENIKLISFKQNGQTFTATPNADALNNADLSSKSAKYKINLKFDIANYYQGLDKKYFEGVQPIELYSTNVTFNIIQAASSVEVDNKDSKIAISTTAKIKASLSTTWLGSAQQNNNVDYLLNGDRIVLNEENKDSLFIDFEVVEGYDVKDKIGFKQIKTLANISTIPEWFKDGIFISYIKDGDKLVYSINLTVFDDFNYRRITTDVKIKITIRAKSNENLACDIVYLTIQPEQLKNNNIYMENYNITRSQPDLNGSKSIVISSAETTYIEPGTIGGLMIIRLEPSYACIDYNNINLTSGYIQTNQTESGRAYIQFEQMVFDRTTGRYITYDNSNNILGVVDDNGNYGIIGKHLYPVSECVRDENGNITFPYTGTIYVRMYLTLLVGINEPIRVSLNVNSNGTNVEQHKDLSTSFVPGVVPEFDSGLRVGKIDENNNLVEYATINQDEEPYKFSSYLIEKNSYNNIITLKMYGYQYNGRPSITFKELTPTQDYTYQVGAVASGVGYQFITDFNNPPTMESDGAYTIRIRLSVGEINYPFIMQTSLYLSVDGVSRQQNSSLIFHPTDYILTGLGFENLNSNALADADIRLGSRGAVTLSLGSSKEIKLDLSTTNDNVEQSNLYQKLLTEIADNYPHQADMPSIANLFQVYLNGDWRDLPAVLSDANYNNLRIFNVSTESDSGNLVLSAKTPGRVNFKFNLDYHYSENEIENQKTGVYELHVNNQNSNANNFSRSAVFTLIVNDNATEETPDAIYNETDFLNMRDGGNYILMADLIFDAYRPLTQNVASFDGNNHTITINSFVEDATLSGYGLFSSFDYHLDGNEQVKSTLKNVIVIYNNTIINLQNNQRVTTLDGVVFGGLVATLGEGGIVYNCDVFNYNTDNRVANNVTITMPAQENARLTFGGLVGINNGIITNSRVGYNEYLYIRENNRGIVSATSLQTNDVTFMLGNEQQKQFIGVAGGFVGVNNGRISSSFVANTNLYNYSGNSQQSLTAGFVAENSGRGVISYSYVKSHESSIQNNKDYSVGTTIENRSNGNVGGFVHRNAGEISNSFANVEVKSDSTFIAGFVYDNTGFIHESYAAATLNGGVSTSENPSGQNHNAEQPFVGISRDGELLSNGRMENVYYYNPNSTLLQKEDANKPTAYGLNSESIGNSTFLHGFVFVLSDTSISERNQGVWAYYQYNSNNTRILPELNTANNVAHSYRYFITTPDDISVLHEALGYESGSENNPYIVRDITDFETIFAGDSDSTKLSFTGNVRFINDLDFNNSYISKTSVNYTLGSETAITSLEGNGMSIKNVRLSTGESGASVDEVGLFAKITNSYIKNLSINIGSTPNVGRTKYLGGLAGKIDNSVIVNVNIDGNNVELAGNNFVGGLAGMITGKSLIYGVTSNVSVKVNVNNGENARMYYNQSAYQQMQASLSSSNYQEYLDNLSYAGGLAGVIDLEKRGREKYNLAYVTINNVNSIVGDYAGGIAGYFGGGIGGSAEGLTNKIQAQKLKFYTKTQNTDGVISGSVIRGYHTAGGLFAVSNANIQAAQVTSIESEFDADNDYNQFKIDQAFDDFITALETNDNATLDLNKAGNLKLINGGLYAGGLVGISLGADISSSYAKAGFDLTDNTISTNLVLGGLVGVSFSSKITYSYAIPYINITNDLPRKLTIGGLIGKIADLDNSTGYERELTNFTKEVFKEEDRSAAQYTFSTLIKDNKDINLPDSNYFANQIDNLDTNSLSLYVGENKTFGEGGSSDKLTTKKLLDLFNNDKSTATFDLIFRPFRTTGYWSLTWNRYFPLLLEQSAPNGETIENAQDFKKLVSNRDGNFVIVKDIQIDGSLGRDPNYVLDVTFTGSLTSDKPDHSAAVVTITGLKPSLSKTAGFLKATQNADISNIIFNWSPTQIGHEDATKTASVQVQGKVGIFGGVSAEDNGSSFDQIHVKSAKDELIGTTLYTKDGASISGFGGIVGIATNTKFTNCSYSGQLDAKLSPIDNTIAVGGIAAIAQSKVTEMPDQDALSTSVSVSGCVVGNNTKFNLSGDINTTNAAYIGLMFGSAADADITSPSVANRDEYNKDESNQIFKPQINLSFNNTTIYAGGLVGSMSKPSKQLNSKIDGGDILAEINFSGTGNSNSINIGGVAGETEGEINNVSSDVNIKLTKTTVNTANLAGAVALSNGDGVKIINSVFTGEITANNQPVDNQQNSITNIVAAGIISNTAPNAINTLDTVFAYPIIDVGTSSTTSISMAGLVANSGISTTIANAMSAGRLMVDACSQDISLKIGGVVANSKTKEDVYGKLIVGDSAVITTILTDGINNSTIKDMQYVHALFGDVNNVEVKISSEGTDKPSWLVYSSDFALVNENKDQLATDTKDDGIYNLEARQITSSSWLANEPNWTIVSSGMPYLTQLASKLQLLGFLNGNAYSNTKSTQFNPDNFRLSAESNKEYKYYILSQNVEISAQEVELNGVLLGNGLHPVNATGLVQSQEETGDEFNYYGLIPTVKRHSAISNVHLNVATPLNLTANGVVGLLVGNNLGVVSNCSLAGTNVEISTGCDGLAGLVGNNSGLVAYCYSTIEITSLEIHSYAGLVYTNNAKMYSNYFTGYINNGEGVDAYGIVRNYNVTNTVNPSYMYNNYMAGVIVNVNDNSFGIANNDPDAIGTNYSTFGSNNFVDRYANAESNSEEDKDIFRLVNTSNLMSADGMGDNWHTILTAHTQDSGGATYTINTTSASFGYNYGYPVVKFNKLEHLDSKESLDITKYHLYTGNGDDKTGETDLTNRANKILSDESAYKDAYKIPHFGVLISINGLAKLNKNFVFIYNLDGKILGSESDMLHITSAGGRDNAIQQTQQEGQSDVFFTGVVVSNKNYGLSSDDASEITISNFTGTGLFTNIKNSYFGHIKFSGKFNINNGGVLGNNVQAGENVNANKVYVQNLTYEKYAGQDMQINGLGHTAALFGTIGVNANVNISEISVNEDNNVVISSSKPQDESQKEYAYAGFVAGTNYGTIAFENALKLRVTFGDNNYAGGLVGLSDGTITFSNNDNNLNINQLESTKIDYFGGLIGTTIGGKINNGKLTISLGNEFVVEHFGGIVSQVQESGYFNSSANITITAAAEIFIRNNYTFGGIAADLLGNMEIYNFAICNGESSVQFNITTNAENYAQQSGGKSSESGMGGFIGRQIGNATATINVAKFDEGESRAMFNVNITSVYDNINLNYGKDNLGGLVGYTEGGTLSTAGVDADKQTSTLTNNANITLTGSKNVGGLFGWATELPPSGITQGENGNANKYEQHYNALDGITIYINGEPNKNGDTVVSTQGNVGGLIGLFTGDNLVAGKDEEGNDTTITSKATIRYEKSGNDGTKYVNNIGGVVGKVVNATEIKNLQFNGEIKTFSSDSDDIYLYSQTASTSEMSMFRANNVGGVIGSINFESKDGNKAQAINLVNSSQGTYGYQNVGGVVGYAENVHLYNNKSSVNNANAVYGVINVGGVVGVANNSTIGAETTDATTQGLTTTGSVYGNYNVGGLVGFAVITIKDGTTTAAATTTISNNTIGSETKDIQVKGITYYVDANIRLSSYESMSQHYKSYYLPSNVGALVGFAYSSTLNNNTMYAQVLSSNEGQSNNNGRNSMVISTVSNLMGNVLEGDTISGQYVNPDEAENDGVFFNAEILDEDKQNAQANEHRVKFTQIHSGFGGLAGGASNITSQNNTLHNLQVNAQLGVNVGTIFGYLDAKAGDGQTGVSIAELVNSITITNSDAINIDGGYFIGGVIGNVKASSTVEFSSADITSWGNITINLQSKNSGMYVGSLFGKFETSGIEGENGDTFTIASSSNVTIKINTGNSYYMGGLVGQYYVPAGVTAATFTGDVSGLSGIIIPGDINSITEFGGFIGMLKVEKNTGNSNQKYKDVTVTTADAGKQPYAFTINTIENGNYFDGLSTFSAQEQGNDISLIAQATYVNQDNFTICPTTNNSWYAASKNNPLRTQSTGWAKEYTMFKTMQRNIPAGENKADWDAICPVYDAANITYVATQSNSGNTLNFGHGQFTRDDYNDKTMYDTHGANYIICTIYEAVEGMPMLYSKLGIAVPYYNENGKFAEPEPVVKSGWDKFWGAMRGQVPTEFFPLDLSTTGNYNKVRVMDKLVGNNANEVANAEYKVINGETHKFQGVDSSQSTTSVKQYEETLCCYKVPRYYLKEDGAWFEFEFLYESDNMGAEHRPNDGCVFNVTGVMTDNVEAIRWVSNSEWYRVGWIKVAFVALFAVAGTVAAAMLPGLAPAAGIILSSIIRVASIATYAISGSLYYLAFSQADAILSQQPTYLGIHNQTIGFLGESYQRQVLYRNGIMDDNIDSTWTNEDGILYAYVGTVRPSDYYKNKYFVYYVENADVTEDAKDFKTETVGDLEVSDKIESGTFKGAYNCTYNNHKAYCFNYYAYHNNSYYIVMDALAGSLRYIPDQPYFDFNENSVNQPNLDYIQNNGLIYVRGTYENGSYTMQETNTWNNHWYGSNNEDAKRKTKDDEGNETTLSWQSGNGQFAVDTQQFTYVPVNGVQSDNPNATYGYYLDTSTNIIYQKSEKQKNKDLYLGYGYMQGAYYTANINELTYYNTNDHLPEMVGKFTLYKDDENRPITVAPEGEENIDYIKVTYFVPDGDTATETVVFYTFNGKATGQNANYTLGERRQTTADNYADTLYVNLYPNSFTNEYKNKELGEKVKDSEYYLIYDKNGLSGDNLQGIKHSPTYFYFDGGYETNSDGLVFTEVQGKFTYMQGEETETIDLYGSDEDLQKATNTLGIEQELQGDDSIANMFKLTIYNDTVSEKVTYKHFIENYDKDENYKNYYVIPKDSIPEGMEDTYKVKNNYIVKNDHIYALDSNYIVYQTTGDGDSNAYLNGMICYTKLQIPNAGGSTNSWNFNKYCVDIDKGIYARYSYSGLELTQEKTPFKTSDDKKYLLYNNGFNRPNGGGTTYFVEGVRVILGGGGEYQILDEGTNSRPGNNIGSITCG